jgi:REP element-mobilizing transposase RayT
LTYLITFACYGCRLHGDESGSIDRKHNLPGRRLVAADLKRVSAERGQMDQPPYSMDPKRRKAVLEALLDSCSYRNWNVLAAHVRSSHAHIVVESEAPPERIMNDLKSYARRHLNRMGLDLSCSQAVGTAWKHPMVVESRACVSSGAVRIDEQGERMSVFEAGYW